VTAGRERGAEAAGVKKQSPGSGSGVIAWTACFLVCLGAACKPENPLASGLTPELEAQLVRHTIEEIQSSETFDPASFETRQRTHFESMTEAGRDTALEHLPRRVDEIKELGMSQSVRLDPGQVEVDWQQLGPGKIAAEVSIPGDRAYQAKDGSRTIKTRYILPWGITTERGKPVFQHQGIRTVNL